LPHHLSAATVVPLGETFLLVGGFISDTFPQSTDTIYQYEKLSDSWTLLNTKIPYRSENPMALMVDIDIFPSCSTTTTTATSADSTTSETELLPQCFVAGECEGDLIGIFADIAGADDCLVACKNTSGCVWFTEFEVILPFRHNSVRNDVFSSLAV